MAFVAAILFVVVAVAVVAVAPVIVPVVVAVGKNVQVYQTVLNCFP